MPRILSLSVLMLLLIAFSPAAPPVRTVTIVFIAPPESPAADSVYLAGNLEQFGSWKADGVLLSHSGRHRWKHKFSIPAGIHIEFKITRGSWESEAVYEKGVKADNTTADILHDTTITLRAIAWGNNKPVVVGQITGTVRYHRNLLGEGLKYPRDLIVWLPPSYGSSPERRFPVLYMHDGQNIIDPATSTFGYDWRVDEVGDSLMKAGLLREMIVVGIYNTPDRMSEYRDTAAGVAYGKFIVGRVKPMIDSLYRTLPDRKNTAIMGSSLGGLISFLCAWWYPDVFGQAACLSTVFLPQYTAVISTVRSTDVIPNRVRLYLDCGGAGGDETLKPGIDSMRTLLLGRGYADGKDLVTFFDTTAVHNEKAWAHRLWRPLLFLFPVEKF
ncbi:MAG TPA: alpha/beta hydrolase-fold protein [Bacteroidota bacterium]|nr:alpha/beta hydrolase-fold protein [Bacteroidota bacterium]